VRLRIGGEQLNGCWMSLRDGRDDPPYEGAWIGTTPAACVSWAD
jgi:hypothetical protein